RTGLLAVLARAGGRAGPLLEALLVGVRDELDADLSAAFRDSGCAHILALSGQHLGILAALAAALLGPLMGPIRARRLSCVLVVFYLWLVGPSPSVTRAAVMYWLAALCAELDRPQPVSDHLCAAFALALILEPAQARTLSFQLSYLAVLGMALCGGLHEFLLARWLPPKLARGMAAGTSALSATAPLSVMVFGRLNPVSPFASLAAGPLVSALMWLGLAGAAVVALVPRSFRLVRLPCEAVYGLLSRLMGTAARFPAVTAAGAGDGGKLALAGLVAALAALVYAVPHAAYRAGLARYRAKPESPGRSRGLRLAQGAGRPAGQPGLCHAEALWAELPDSPSGQKQDSGPPGGGVGPPRVGGRARRGRHDPGSPARRPGLERLRD
ncbi:MAG TPA: ComEC/Rec2 family competence protein, partial [Spirochaetales bacterium]|nr:ComEC/Rec2 family competence protein [Spirochaetales bacterium]